MNKIYKLVWSKVRNIWVVASEIAKGHGKSSSSEGNGKLLKSLVLTALLGSFVTAGISPVAALTPDQQAVYNAVLQKLETEKKTVHYFSVGPRTGMGAGSNYNNDGATRWDAIAIGVGAKAENDKSTAIGLLAQAQGSASMALGYEAQAQGLDSTALGVEAQAQGGASMALGVFAQAQGLASTALGHKAQAQGKDSMALGYSATAQGKDSTALGKEAQAQGNYSTALGVEAQAQGLGSTALGAEAKAQGKDSMALGVGAKAQGKDSMALGYVAQAQGLGSTALGNEAIAYGNLSQATGGNAWSIGDYSQASGYNAVAAMEKGIDETAYDALSDEEKQNYTYDSQMDRHKYKYLYYRTKFKEYTGDEFKALSAMEQYRLMNEKGYRYYNEKQVWTLASGAVAIGHEAKAFGLSTLAVGDLAEATGKYAVAVGREAEATDVGNTALGYYAKAKGNNSIAMGLKSSSIGESSIALGGNAKTQAQGSVAIGMMAESRQNGSVALGEASLADRAAGAWGLDISTGQAMNEDALLGAGKAAYDEAKAKLTELEGQAQTLTREYEASLAREIGPSGYPVESAATRDIKSKLDAKMGEVFAKTMEVKNAVKTWSATEGAISVGNTERAITRQITGVAAGTEDTDAVNVAQLKKVAAMSKSATVDIEAGDNNVTVNKDANTGKYKISATDTTLKTNANALSINNGKLNLSIEDTKGNKVTGSVDLNSIQGAAGTGKTYTMTETKNSTDNTTTISLKDNNGNEQKVTVATKDTNTYTTGATYDAATKKLKFAQNDPAKNYEIDVSAMLNDVVDTDTTYTMTGTEDSTNNTTTIALKDNKGNEQKVTVATKDTNTYTTGATYDAGSKKLTFTRNDNQTYDVDFSGVVGSVTGDTRNTIAESSTIAVDGTNTNADGSINYKLNVKTDGKVEKDNTGIVTGGTVCKETRIEKDGKYIKKDNTAGQNLSALDKQVGINTEKIQRLDTRVDRVGAGVAALAGLHPLDYDPENKWDFAAGYGNYNGANAVAIGAFYRPDENKMISIGGSFGGGENMVSAGVSVKLGQGTGISTSKVAMAKEIKNLKIDNERMQAENKEMKQEIEVLKEQMQKLLAGK